MITRRTVFAWLAVSLFGCKKSKPGVLVGTSTDVKTEAGWPKYPEELINGVWTTDQADVFKWQLACRKKLASQTPGLGYSTCASCGLPWWCVQGHSITFENGSGCFVVCEMCWENLGADALPFYEAWVMRNYPGDTGKLERVRKMEEF